MSAGAAAGSPEHPRIGDVVWTPTEAVMKRSRLRRFMDLHGIATYRDLHARSVEDMVWFWDAAVRDVGIDFYRPYDQVLDDSDGPAWTRWFVGGRMNVVHSCLDRYRGTAQASKVAVIWEGEPGDVRHLTYAELDEQVCAFAAGLRRLRIGVGDRVGIFMPLLPEAPVAALGCAKVGAVIVPLFSGYGADAVATRLRDCSVKLLVCADGYHRRGRVVPMKEVADAAVALSPTVMNVVVVERTGGRVAWVDGRDLRWADVVSRDGPRASPTVSLDPESPLMIIYTSGTTGKPKGTVHVHGGFPVKGTADMVYGFDASADDTIFWFTDLGWMMGPWLIYGTLIVGATMVLYEGAPDSPAPDRLWRMIGDHRVTIFGLSPTLVRALRAASAVPTADHDLASLRVVGATGELWDSESWLWCFEHVCHRRIPIINNCGGTELSGAILHGNVLTPLRPTSFSGPILGMSADVVDAAGLSVRGAVGELVLRGPNPGMTRGFWGDRERYLDAYWRPLPGVWQHGDWAYVDAADDLWYVLGRSDDIIKVAGKRVGPGEVESVLSTHPLVLTAAAFGVPDAMTGEGLVCLAVRTDDPTVDDARLCRELSDAVARQLGKPLRPRTVRLVPALPLTRNGKLVRRAIRSAFLGLDPGDISAIDNPRSLEAITAAGASKI